ncbi:22895_t:CDS:2, partial [Gigaspora rosea]
ILGRINSSVIEAFPEEQVVVGQTLYTDEERINDREMRELERVSYGLFLLEVIIWSVRQFCKTLALIVLILNFISRIILNYHDICNDLLETRVNLGVQPKLQTLKSQLE